MKSSKYSNPTEVLNSLQQTCEMQQPLSLRLPFDDKWFLKSTQQHSQWKLHKEEERKKTNQKILQFNM